MKNKIFCILSICLLFVSCEKDEELIINSELEVEKRSLSKSNGNRNTIFGEVIPLTPLLRKENPYNGARVDNFSSIVWKEALEKGDKYMEGVVFYIPAYDFTNRKPIYRAYNNKNHFLTKDVNEASKSGYWIEGIMGYPWDGSNAEGIPNLSKILRTYNTQNGNHSFISSSENIGKNEVIQDLKLYGLKRFLNDSLRLVSSETENVKISSNIVAGGALWEWFDKRIDPEFNFINDYDYGRQIQTAFNIEENGVVLQPTEGGDYFSHIKKQKISHGSNCVSHHITNEIHSTLSMPLEWKPWKLISQVDSSYQHPVIYKDLRVGKNIKLNVLKEINAVIDIHEYETIVECSKDIILTGKNNLEVITGYMDDTLKNIRQFTYSEYLNSNGEGGFSEIDKLLTPNESKNLSSSLDAIMLYDESESKAFGIFSFNDSNKLNTDSTILNSTAYSVTKFIGSAKNFNTIKWSVYYNKKTLGKGKNRFKNYIITGSKEEVKQTIIKMAKFFRGDQS